MHGNAVPINWLSGRCVAASDRQTDKFWPAICPACGSRSFVAGVKYAEEVSDQDDGYSDEETVDIMLNASQFHCPSCGLHLDSRDEIEAVGLVTDWTESETRQREYEPDYGNE
jgi:predicted RNA-binding Zn-ribbon protein involved in translation (DUF1610 family)